MMKLHFRTQPSGNQVSHGKELSYVVSPDGRLLVTDWATVGTVHEAKHANANEARKAAQQIEDKENGS